MAKSMLPMSLIVSIIQAGLKVCEWIYGIIVTALRRKKDDAKEPQTPDAPKVP